MEILGNLQVKIGNMLNAAYLPHKARSGPNLAYRSFGRTHVNISAPLKLAGRLNFVP